MTATTLCPVIFLAAVSFTMTTSVKTEDRPHLKAALEAARWIRSAAVETPDGTTWPADPNDPKSVNPALYSGTAGVVLFFLEAHHATGDETYLKDARAGADYLLASLDSVEESGLYNGIAGIGFALNETFKSTRDDRYARGAKQCVEILKQRANKVGAGIEWNSTTDIIRGSAGIGLFLLYAAEEMKEPSVLELASAAGKRLIELGRPAGGGLKWAMRPDFPRLMPNFSHGTAGNAYFLARLYEATNEQAFLDAALAGANYLQSIATESNDGVLIFHHEPEGEDLFYLGWCHGPAGTAQLFYQLHKITGDERWMNYVKKLARGVMQCNIPEQRMPGFWNNVGICCGSAGVAEFFLDLHKLTGDRSFLALSRKLTADLLSRATRDGNGLRWIQSEHRVKPDLLIAQTGYMQGAAGIGRWLLHMDAFERGKRVRVRLPDSPF